MDIFKTAFDMFPKLDSNNFALREAKESDWNEIYDIYSNEEAVKYQEIPTMKTKEQAKKSISHFLNSYKNKRFIRWCIVYRNYDKIIGLITLHDLDTWNSKAEIGYMLNRKFWRQNIMTECAEKVIEYAFEVIKLHRLEAMIHPENIASIKLNSKLGFELEGLKKECAYNRKTEEFEDRFLYALINKR
ncbi:GNAT family N-acetyltransferase [Clostridium sp. 19966]|uniref:GNAT family N-acetyltransferase n=1 Tax=Clostridium sp. 19966 TaxID=2768166 RepID=UPI0028DE247E|nr:GNAT family N-acetyltransferase [Clostridium sp. 19966]MDT8717520.1 GNAT family N-acetyltransferase [Clostridium sp. 19966]